MTHFNATQRQPLYPENMNNDVERTRRIAQSESASPQLLQHLSLSQEPLVREAVAANPNTPIETLFKLAREFPEQFLDNPVFSLLALEYPNLVDAIPKEALIPLLRCDRVPDFLVQQALNHPSASRAYAVFREAVASDPYTPTSKLDRLAIDNKKSVRIAVAKNPNTLASTLKQLATDKESLVRIAVAKHLNTSASTLDQLVTDKELSSVLTAVAKHFKTPIPILERLAADKNTFVREAVAKNRNTLASTLERLAADKEELVRKAVAQNRDRAT
ncbi:MAG: hypothetical protein SW833_13590 [Cyanobacteriota bacterium]|nr:hypothetical protein [Cyanobacteriota bacterium]